jgi:hypothetical protein
MEGYKLKRFFSLKNKFGFDPVDGGSAHAAAPFIFELELLRALTGG